MVGQKDIKDTEGKLEYTHLQWEAIEAVAKVFQYAKKKYGNCDSWRNLGPDSKNKYMNALIRHIVECLKGNELDTESGFPHAYAIAWNALTYCFIKLKEEK